MTRTSDKEKKGFLEVTAPVAVGMELLETQLQFAVETALRSF